MILFTGGMRVEEPENCEESFHCGELKGRDEPRGHSLGIVVLKLFLLEVGYPPPPTKHSTLNHFHPKNLGVRFRAF